MPEYNKSKAPYYDFYNNAPTNINIPEELRKSEKEKGYTQLLAVPGRVAQAREITQMQSAVKSIVKSVGDGIFKDGNIIEGCQVIINSDKTTAIVTAGKVYLNGMVLPISETSIAIAGQGTETIGFKLREVLITEVEDSTLRDPAQGYDNFNQPGCHRIKSEAIIVKDDPDSAILTTLINGEVSVERYAPEYDALTVTLARRTDEESGSYIVDGLQVSTETSKEDNTLMNVKISSGKAYVKGFELGIPNDRTLSVPRATGTDFIPDYPITFENENNLKYRITENSPVIADITSVTRLVRESITRNKVSTGIPVSIYTHEDLSISFEGERVISVYTKSGNSILKTYSEGSDYTASRDGNTFSIKWLTESPDQYFVDIHKRVRSNPEEYKLYMEVMRDSRGDNVLVQGIEFLDDSKLPVDNTDFHISYNRYLARKDIVYMNVKGEIYTIQGRPSRNGTEVLPDTPSEDHLLLAYISSPANGGSDGSEYGENITEEAKKLLPTYTRIYVSNIGVTRFTMQDIKRIVERLKTVEYDQAILSLNDEAKSYNTSSEMRGIFTDPMIDFSRVSLNYSGLLNDKEFNYGAVINVEDGICYLPIKSRIGETSYNRDLTTAHEYNRTLSLKKTSDRVVLSQSQATKGFLVNPYTTFPQSPEISIVKNIDNWYDDTEIEVPESVSSGNSVVIATEDAHADAYNTRGARRPSVTDNGKVTDTIIGTQVDRVISGDIINTIIGDAITYIRPDLTITVTGNQFPKNAKNIKCYFDGVLVPLTIDPSANIGSQYSGEAVSADDYGRFVATFKTPSGVRTGIKEVKVEIDKTGLSEEDLINLDGYLTSAIALYQAEGYKRTLYRKVTQITSNLIKRVTTYTTTHYIDPVGQTFVLDSMSLISGVDLYFQQKPSVDIPITCEIREVVNGSITSTSYGSKTLSASEVSVDAVTAKTATRFKFDNPILVEANKEYAIVVRSVANSYKLWVAELGEPDVSSQQPVVTNPYLIGVMMSSSNNSSWTMHQTTDLKFALIEDLYENTSEVVFEDISTEGDIDFSRIYLSADSITPEGTSVDWSYLASNTKTNSNTGFQYIYPNDMLALSSMYDKITLKATLSKKDNVKLSPILSLDTVGAALSTYENEGYYVTKEIQGIDEYSNVDIILDSYTPTDTSIEVYVNYIGDNDTWMPVPLSPDPSDRKVLDYGWIESTYRVSGIPGESTCRVLVKLNTDYNYKTPAFRRLRVIMS